MLKKFLLNSLSSFVGTWIALVLFGVAAVMIAVGVAVRVGSENGVSNSVKPNSVLVIDLNGTVTESTEASNPDYLELIQGNLTKPSTLNQLVEGIKSAGNNKNINALYILSLYVTLATTSGINIATNNAKPIITGV